MPGGCNFGVRPIDQHIKGFEAARRGRSSDGGYAIIAPPPGDGLTGGSRLSRRGLRRRDDEYYARRGAGRRARPSSKTRANEPHIVDLANFLNSMGADVRGAGTDVIKMRGVEQHARRHLHHHPRPDRGRHLYGRRRRRRAADVLIKNVIPKHLGLHHRQAARNGRARWTEYDDSVRVRATGRLAPRQRQDHAVPRLPDRYAAADRRAALRWRRARASSPRAFGTTASAISSELTRMGANIQVDGKHGRRRGRGEAARRARATRTTCARARRWSSRAWLRQRRHASWRISSSSSAATRTSSVSSRLLGADIRIIDEPDGTERGTAVAG